MKKINIIEFFKLPIIANNFLFHKSYSFLVTLYGIYNLWNIFEFFIKFNIFLRIRDLHRQRAGQKELF